MLKIFYYTATPSFTDYSRQLENYLDLTQSITLATGQYIYVGYKKPINALYFGINTVNTSASVLTAEYYNGSTFAACAGMFDKTAGFTRQNFVTWDRNQSNEARTTINSVELFWYRLSVSVTTSATIFSGINLVLSDDTMIKEIEPHIVSSDYYPSTATSFLCFHQAARNEIIQRLRNEGKGVYDGTSFSDLTVFDLLDFTQLSEASKYLACANIYFYLSDANEDKYYQKYKDYLSKYNDAFKTFFLSIDENDDGLQNEDEKAAFMSGVIQRV
jgi:hypothetical protein